MDGTISEQSKFFKDCNPEQALERRTSGGETILFWVVWMILIAGFVVGFLVFDNRWLDKEEVRQKRCRGKEERGEAVEH